MTLRDAMENRRSVRRYRPDAVPRETLERLVSAAILAPSGCNAQGWVFVVVDDPETKGRVAAATQYGRFIADAGACVAVFCDRRSPCAVEDCAAATENMMLAAVEEGLGTCWVHSHGVGHATAVEKLLDCPPTHELMVLMAVGVPEGTPVKPVKKALGEVLRWNGF